MLELILTLVGCNIALLSMALMFKFAPKDYPEFHEKNPFVPYFGVQIHFGLVKITSENWEFIKKMGFRSFGLAIPANTILSLATTLPFPQYSVFLTMSSCAIFCMGCATIFLLIKVATYGE